jgi:hypothetical protein
MRKSKENIKKLKQLWCLEGKVFLRLANEHRQFVQDLVMNLQALAVVLERHGYPASCYTCGDQMNSASFMVSLGDNHLIRFLVSDYGITWTEMRDDRELMKLEGAEAINQLEELATLVKQSMENVKHSESPKAKVTLQNAVGSVKTHR